MPSKMIERIASQARAPNLVPALTGLPASDLQSLLLQDKKRLLTSGIGTEFVCLRYRAP